MSRGSTQPFRATGTTAVAAGTSAAVGTLANEGEAALAYNSAGSVAFVRFGTDNTVVAKNTDTPVPPGARMLMHVGNLARTVSVLLASGSGTVYVTRGDGTVY